MTSVYNVLQAACYDFMYGVQYAWNLVIFALVLAFSLTTPLIVPFGEQCRNTRGDCMYTLLNKLMNSIFVDTGTTVCQLYPQAYYFLIAYSMFKINGGTKDIL